MEAADAAVGQAAGSSGSAASLQRTLAATGSAHMALSGGAVGTRAVVQGSSYVQGLAGAVLDLKKKQQKKTRSYSGDGWG